MIRIINQISLFILISTSIYGAELYNTTNKNIIFSGLARKRFELVAPPEKMTEYRKVQKYRRARNLRMTLEGYQKNQSPLLNTITDDEVLIAEEDPKAEDNSGLRLTVVAKENFAINYEDAHEKLSGTLPFSNDIVREVEKYFFGDDLLVFREDRAIKKKAAHLELSQQSLSAQLEEEKRKLAALKPQHKAQLWKERDANIEKIHQNRARDKAEHDKSIIAQITKEQEEYKRRQYGRKEEQEQWLASVPGQDHQPASVRIPVQEVPTVQPAPQPVPQPVVNPIPVPAPVQVPVQPIVVNRRPRWITYTAAAVAVIGSLVAAKKLYDWFYPQTRSA